jgi:hypothetical protein
MPDHARSLLADCPVTEANLVDVTGLPVAVRWLLAIVVVLISGFFAGEWRGRGEAGDPEDAPVPALSHKTPYLPHSHAPGMTLGIMGLDKVGLQIVATAGDTEKERRHARAFFFFYFFGEGIAPSVLIGRGEETRDPAPTHAPLPPAPAGVLVWNAAHPDGGMRRRERDASCPPPHLSLIFCRRPAPTRSPRTHSLSLDLPSSLSTTGRLLPIREKGNWLMCTLLIANTVANVFLPILVASFAGGLVGFIVSTVLILLLAEIVPQVSGE